MPWQDDFQQGSFKNLIFYVTSHNVSGGKRLKLWEEPQGNNTEINNLGNKTEAFAISAYYVAQDYFQARNDLIKAFKADGPGLLVHPYLGEINVYIETWKVSEQITEGGMFRFTIRCIPEGDITRPKAVQDIASSSKIVKENAFAELKRVFEAAYNIKKAAFSAVKNAQRTLNKGINTVSAVKTGVSDIAAYQQKLKALEATSQALLHSPSDLAESMIEIIDFGTNPADIAELTVETSKEAFNNVESLFKFQGDDPILYTDSPSAQISQLIQLSSIISGCSLLPLLTYDSLEQAEEYTDAVFQSLENYLFLVEDDVLYSALYDLRTVIGNGLSEVQFNLPRISTLTLPQTLPAIIVSFNAYGDNIHEQDIINRNDVFLPAFTPAAEPLEVLIYE